MIQERIKALILNMPLSTLKVLEPEGNNCNNCGSYSFSYFLTKPAIYLFLCSNSCSFCFSNSLASFCSCLIFSISATDLTLIVTFSSFLSLLYLFCEIVSILFICD